MSLVRTGHRETALDEASQIYSSIKNYRKAHSNSELSHLFKLTPASTGAMVTGYVENLKNIIRALKAENEIPADEFDPML